MTSVAPIANDQDFTDESPAATDKVDAAALDAQLAAVKNKINALLTALALVIRDDDTLVDELVRLRNLHPEILTAIAANDAWLPKVSVACASTANLTLSGEQTIDGVLTSASRILVKDQTAGAENGIYVTGAGAWTRATDADSATELGLAAVLVLAGTQNANSAWVQTVVAASITVGTTALVWAQFSGQPGTTPVAKGGTGQTAIAAWPTTFRRPARVAAIVSTSIAAPGATIDGVTMAVGDRVLLTAQSTASQNGLWQWNGAAVAMTRTLDYAGASTVQAFQDIVVRIREGTAGGGGEWRLTTTGAITIDTTSTAWLVLPVSGSFVTATGSTTARTLANRFAANANVLDYGAVADGVTDDTAAILAAIGTGGRTVFFPPGVYYIAPGNGINILYDDVDLVFARGASLKKLGTGAAITLARAAATTINRVGIYGARITSADTTTACSGITIAPDAGNRADYVTIEDCVISGMGQYGIVSGGGVGDHSHLTLSNVRVLNNGAVSGNWVRQAIVLRPSASSTNLILDNVYAEQINDGTGATDGMKLQNFVGATINNLTVKGGNVSTLVFDGMQDWVADNLQVIGTGGNGFTFQSSATGRAEITNVLCRGTFASDNAIVLGNQGCVDVALRNFRAVGILMGATTGAHTRLTVENGYLTAGVRLDSESSVTVANSVFRNLRTETGLFYILGNNNEVIGCRTKASTSAGVIAVGNGNTIRECVHLSPTGAGVQVNGNANVIDGNWVLSPGGAHVNVAGGTGNIIGTLHGSTTITDSGTATVRTLASVPHVGGIGSYTAADTTPDVTGVNFMRVANSGAVTVTAFDGGVVGQRLLLSFADANTTVDRTHCFLAGGANFVSTAEDTLDLVCVAANTWAEVGRSANS